jgi:cytoskeletal protein CcmA (bactofilin family)
VRGDIFAPRVTLKDGAQFKGSIDMDASEDTRIMPQSEADTSTLAALPASTTNGKNVSGQRNTTLKSEIDELAETSPEKIPL